MANEVASSPRRAQARQLLVFSARRTFDVEAARDLTAETFGQAFESRRRFRGSIDPEAAGRLYRIVRHSSPATRAREWSSAIELRLQAATSTRAVPP